VSAVLEAVPPREAIAALLARGAQLDPSFSWLDVWQEEHARAFTVAKSAGHDILQDIHASLLKALAEGKTLRDFARELRPLLEEKGWWGRTWATDPETGERRVVQLGSSRRLRTIFETNMRVSYAAGHWARFDRHKSTRPFLRYVAILDERTRPHHRRLHNLVLPVDHPFWNEWAPPNGWGCRCTLQQLSQRDVDRLVAEGEQLIFVPPEITTRRFVNRRTGEISEVPDGIDPGWAYNPGAEGYRATEERLRRKLQDGLSFDAGAP
jgi:SPP1 gp7 family putative phage head morphogenesis protein